MRHSRLETFAACRGGAADINSADDYCTAPPAHWVRSHPARRHGTCRAPCLGDAADGAVARRRRAMALARQKRPGQRQRPPATQGRARQGHPQSARRRAPRSRCRAGGCTRFRRRKHRPPRWSVKSRPASAAPNKNRLPKPRPTKNACPHNAPRTAARRVAIWLRWIRASASLAPTTRVSAKCWTTKAAPMNSAGPERSWLQTAADGAFRAF